MGAADNKRSVIVGIFVFLAIVIFVAGIFTLAGQQKRFIPSIQVFAVFDDVSGLRAGNNVWFSGVKVGTVKLIRLAEGAKVEVFMSIEANATPFIRENAIARISSESFIGNRNIVIEGGTLEASPIDDGDRLRAVNPLDTDALLETLKENAENLIAITNDVKQITSNLVEGEGTVGALLTDTVMADNVRAIVSNLQNTSASTVRASRELSRFTTKLNTGGGLVDELLTDTTVFNRLQVSAAQIQQTTAAAAALTEQLQEASRKLNQNNNALGVLLNDEQLSNQLRGTLQNLETSTEKFDENMEALQHVWPFRRGIRRAARETSHQPE
jgi:phospholipid/cholesterol/gamma-HCH transport system substrate-binding protein